MYFMRLWAEIFPDIRRFTNKIIIIIIIIIIASCFAIIIKQLLFRTLVAPSERSDMN